LLIYVKGKNTHIPLTVSDIQKCLHFRENQPKVGLRAKETILSARFLSEKLTNE